MDKKKKKLLSTKGKRESQLNRKTDRRPVKESKDFCKNKHMTVAESPDEPRESGGRQATKIFPI